MATRKALKTVKSKKKKGAKKGAKGGKAKKNSIKMAAGEVACMTFNADATRLAIGVGKEVHIFSNGDEDEALPTLARNKWTKTHTLAAHDLEVSGVDWCPQSNKLITCSHDRNAFVWTLNKRNEWKQGLVILRITRAALATKWSPNGNKFAVTSGAKKVPICRYDEGDDWWIAEMITKHKSSVVAVDWHPNNQVIATASTDFKCRIISAYLKKVDAEQVSAPFDEESFGTVLGEFDCKGWVVDCAFSPSGDRLAYVGQDSSVTIVNCDSFDTSTHKTGILPFQTILFIDETNLIAAGFDFEPFKIAVNADGEVTLGKSIDIRKAKKQAKELTAAQKFKLKDKKGLAAKEAAIETRHQGSITCMRRCTPTHICTASSDGRIMFWEQ